MRNSVFKFVTLFCFLSIAWSDARAADRKPNVILIVADDLGYGELGCYGQEKFQTPNIDRIAAGGLKFTNHYSRSTVCAPTRCTNSVMA